MSTVKAFQTPDALGTGNVETQTFVKVRRVRSFDDVVDQVRTAITTGSIVAGERLPSEREFAEQFGVSRATLREALRALEAVGLIEIRLGSHGGAFATDGAIHRQVESLRQVLDVELAVRSEQTQTFRASLHADNATWVQGSVQDLAVLSGAMSEGSRAFLLTLAECSNMPLRVALAGAVEGGDDEQVHSLLTIVEMQRVIDLLESGHHTKCRDLLFAMLSRPRDNQ